MRLSGFLTLIESTLISSDDTNLNPFESHPTPLNPPWTQLVHYLGLLTLVLLPRLLHATCRPHLSRDSLRPQQYAQPPHAPSAGGAGGHAQQAGGGAGAAVTMREVCGVPGECMRGELTRERGGELRRGRWRCLSSRYR